MPHDSNVEEGNFNQRLNELLSRILALAPTQTDPPAHSTWVDCSRQSPDLTKLYQASE
ncbi:hypothetical protein [Magnetospirillum sp. SS-4]|uniref:hypothetical protein n=1 Tax=Magnetospirillum sp. SS-4 TaxID=2681465 RepID=UPI0013851AAE|nr:hypothetical protein [Magnetospirillum sp. SS-4]CAA7616863.1 hypothetical protein MTBSS4_170021 [Magnetospirillum sp. SS-4]